MLRPLCFLLGLVPGVYSDFTLVALNFFDAWKGLLDSVSDFLAKEKPFLNTSTVETTEEPEIPDLFASTVSIRNFGSQILQSLVYYSLVLTLS